MDALHSLATWMQRTGLDLVSLGCFILAGTAIFERRRRISKLQSSLSGRLRRLGHRSYSAYLASAHWQKLRALKALRGAQCFACAKTRALTLHHRTYARLGRERDDDVLWLCDGCHKRTHAIAARHGNLERAHLVLRNERRTQGLRVGHVGILGDILQRLKG